MIQALVKPENVLRTIVDSRGIVMWMAYLLNAADHNPCHMVCDAPAQFVLGNNP